MLIQVLKVLRPSLAPNTGTRLPELQAERPSPRPLPPIALEDSKSAPRVTPLHYACWLYPLDNL